MANTLSLFYEEWAGYQRKLRDVIAPLTVAQLAQRAAPNLRSIGENAQHIIAARAYWFCGFLGEGDATDEAYRRWDEPDHPALPGAEIAAGLDATWALVSDRLARWDADDMAHTFPRQWRGKQHQLSRSWVTWHVLEHDLHHGGEISLLLGLHGLASPDV